MSGSKVFAAGIALMGLVGLMGCDGMDKDRVVRKTNAIYKNVRVVLTDESIKERIPDETREKLAEVERVYLEAVRQLEGVERLDSLEGREALGVIVECCDVILGVIDEIGVRAEYEDVIDVVRLSVKVLKINLE